MKWLWVSTLLLASAACGGGGGGMECEYPQHAPAGETNDPSCPSLYGGDDSLGSLCFGHSSCPVSGVLCRYYGAGDGRPGCQAIAIMSCGPPFESADADAGSSDSGTTLVWTCAN
jgi:hypothetical protein